MIYIQKEEELINSRNDINIEQAKVQKGKAIYADICKYLSYQI